MRSNGSHPKIVYLMDSLAVIQREGCRLEIKWQFECLLQLTVENSVMSCSRILDEPDQFLSLTHEPHIQFRYGSELG